MDLQDKVGIVTGAARGIGRAIALELVREGMNVVAVDLKKESLGDLVKYAEGLGAKILALEVDVTSLDATERMARKAIDQWGQIDVLVNNADVIVAVPFLEMKKENWERIINVNLGGVFHCCKARNVSGVALNVDGGHTLV